MRDHNAMILVAILLLVGFLPYLEGQEPKPGTPLKPLSEILNPDGTLRLGTRAEGSFDPRGFRLDAGPGGKPRFVPLEPGLQQQEKELEISAVGDESWDRRFGCFNTNGDVYVIAVSGEDVYVGGQFTVTGGIVANNIAKWDGTSWSALGDGVNGYVAAIAVSEGDVYVGGYFTQAGGEPANYIAKWDGTSWSTLGSGVSYTVFAIAVIEGGLYVGGYFTLAGGSPAHYIAQWDGSSWSALGDGVNWTVLSIAVSGTDVYVGGAFTQAGGEPADYVARWDGNDWSALDSGVNYYAYAIAVIGTDVYVGGQFTEAGGQPAANIAMWDGAGWSTLGSGLSNGNVRALTVSGSDLVVGGSFTQAGGDLAWYIAKWDGAGWSSLGSGLRGGGVRSIAVSEPGLLVGGSFTQAGGHPANHIAEWDGAAWIAQGSGVSSTIHAIGVSGSDVYVAGGFLLAGGQPAAGIAKWNGTSWSTLGSGMNNWVYAIAVSGTDVYAGGYFTQAGGVAVNNIAKWDGASWTALGSGVDYTVTVIAVSGTDVYVGGLFTHAGGLPANHIAKWDGGSWSALGAGLNGDVYAIAVSGTVVYVGGMFTTAGGSAANHIARWNGSTWSALGSGVNNYVYTIAAGGPDIYVGGGFTEAGSGPANGIAKWNGSTWSALGSGVSVVSGSAWVFAVAVNGTDVYAGGQFTQAGAQPATNIAKWNGSTWSALGSGVNSLVFAAALNGPDLYAGGEFTLAGGKSSSYLGRWIAPLAVTAPNGAEVWEAGSGQTITWTGSAEVVKIEYSADDGETWTMIVASTDNDGSYGWTVPNSPSSTCLVRISDASNIDLSDASDGPFTISGFVVTSPDGGEEWMEGTAQTITWRTVGSYPTVSIQFSANGGADWSAIATEANTGSHPWTVPYNPQTQCLIRVCEPTDLAPSDTSDEVFAILPAVAPSITVTSPNGGETWAAGSGHQITWTQTALTGTVTIDLYKSAVFQKSLGSADVEAGTFSWLIGTAETPGAGYRILIWQGAISDDSDADFAIVSATPARIMDFNGDGQEDILWRYQGEGSYQGLNVVWLMGQTGLPAPLGSEQALAPETSLLSGTPANTVYQTPQGAGKGLASVPKTVSKSILARGEALSLRSGLVMRDPMDHGQRRSASDRGRLGGRDLVSILTRKHAADLEALDSEPPQAASFELVTEVVFSQVADTGWEIAGTGDFNGDTKTDILWRNYGTGGCQGLNDIWFMDGTTFLSESIFSQIPDTNWRIAGTGDFNGDEETDILWRYYGTGAYQGLNVIWYMNDATFVGETVFSQVLDTDWRIEGTGDFNGDGETDILWRYYGTGAYQGLNDIWFMNEATFVSEAVFSQILDTNWQIGGTGDFNNDGHTDILWRFYGTGAYQGLNDIWYMDGTTFVSEEVFSQVMDTNWRISNR